MAKKELISKEDVRKLATLARIRTTPAEEEKLAADMEHILDYVQQIQGISGASGSGSSVPGNSVQASKNILRDDAEPHQSGVFSEDLLSAAPARQGQFVKVKKIL
jgi:aspartyl-tRNA(Asn)/glutamyl-tRNA(Gln) amidotransferase subunit C